MFVELRFGRDEIIEAEPLSDRLRIETEGRRRHHQAVAGRAIRLDLRARAG